MGIETKDDFFVKPLSNELAIEKVTKLIAQFRGLNSCMNASFTAF
jgi:hypothetical protein